MEREPRLKLLCRRAQGTSRAGSSCLCCARCREIATAEGVKPPRPAQKLRRDLLALLCKIPSNGDGSMWCAAATLHAQVARGLLGVAGRDAERGQRQKVLGHHALRTSRAGTSWRRCVRCRATETAQGVGPPRPEQKGHGDFFASLGKMPINCDVQRCWAVAPPVEAARGLLGVVGRGAKQRVTAENVGLPRPTLKPFGNFLVSLGEVPSDGDR